VGEANGGKKTKPLTAKRYCLLSSKSSKFSASVFSNFFEGILMFSYATIWYGCLTSIGLVLSF
jgi:hypothetical protein